MDSSEKVGRSLTRLENRAYGIGVFLFWCFVKLTFSFFLKHSGHPVHNLVSEPDAVSNADVRNYADE